MSESSRPKKRQRTLLQLPDGFNKSVSGVKSKPSNPSFKSAFADPADSGHARMQSTSKVSALTSVRKPVIPASSDVPPIAKPISETLRKPISTTLKPMQLVKHPPAQPNTTPRKPVSVIKPPPPPPIVQTEPRHVKTISTTRIATTMDLDTEDGNMELSSLLIQRDYGLDHVPTSTTDKQISRGLEVSPEKAGHSRQINRKFARGGLADQASIILSRSQTAKTLWIRQMQSTNQKIKPDMRVTVIEVLQTSIRSVLVKCAVLGGLDDTEIQIMLSRPDEDLQLHRGREIYCCNMNSIARLLFCTAMPPKAQPKVFSLTIKSHKLSIILTASQTLSIAALKEEVLSALTSHPEHLSDTIPTVSTVKDFELSRDIKQKGKPAGVYEVLEPSQKVKDHLVNWDTIYIQFREESGKLKPVEVTLPDLVDEDEEPAPLAASSSSVAAGKRKAPDE